MITEADIAAFDRDGFFLITNPFGDAVMQIVERLQREVEPQWACTKWPAGMNAMACQFLMAGETLLELAEKPELVEMARKLLRCDEVVVGACGMGDSVSIVSKGRALQQVQWHSDGGPNIQQVSVRTAFDLHDTPNAPLRVLPGSHNRPLDEVENELRSNEIANGTPQGADLCCFAPHEREVAVELSPNLSLVWTPSCWHATGVKTSLGPRRTMAWNYYPLGANTRDSAVVEYICGDTVSTWSDERRQLWGLST